MKSSSSSRALAQSSHGYVDIDSPVEGPHRNNHKQTTTTSVAILAQVAEKNRQVILAAWVVSGCLF